MNDRQGKPDADAMGPHGAANVATIERPQSPCTEICTLDDDNICLGCHRTLDEIVRWASMSAAEQRSVIAALADRKSSRQR